MDCQQIIELVMKKANEDKEFKKKLIENSEQAILDETGMTMAHKINFFEDDNGELSYEVGEQTVSDDELEGLAGGAGYYHGHGPHGPHHGHGPHGPHHGHGPHGPHHGHGPHGKKPPFGKRGTPPVPGQPVPDMELSENDLNKIVGGVNRDRNKKPNNPRPSPITRPVCAYALPGHFPPPSRIFDKDLKKSNESDEK